MDVRSVDYTARNAPAEFTRSIRETGFGILRTHPIPTDLFGVIRREWLAFFSTGAKHAYRRADGGQDGYFPPPDPRETGLDRKEFFHVGRWGRYPSEVSDAALRYFDEGRALGATLLTWIEAHTPAAVTRRFSMPLSKMLEGSTGSLLRIQHYLPLRADDSPGAVRALAHEDINLMTLLPAPNEPGLQLLDRDGIWHDIPCDPGSLIVNTGEMLHLASGGHYPATCHRVVNCGHEYHRGSRISLPLFLHAADDVVLDPGRTAAAFLLERVLAMRRQGWRPVTAGTIPATPDDRPDAGSLHNSTEGA